MYKRFFSKFLVAALFALGLMAQPALAQGSPQSKFLTAVRKEDGGEVAKFLAEGGSTMVLATDNSTGESALHITIGNRNVQWTSYMLRNGADVNAADKKKITPLMLAVQLGFSEGVEILLGGGAKIDEQNKFGETALILAVHNTNLAMVRQLLKGGANPDKYDYSGQSARTIADRDPRATSIAALIKNGVASEPEKPAQGKLDFSMFGKEEEKKSEGDKP